MTSNLSAFGVLELCMVVGFIAALFGFLGGRGGLLLLQLRFSRAEAAIASLTMSTRGKAGQETVAANRQRQSKADQEAEALAAELQSRMGARAPRGGPRGLKAAIAAEGLPGDEDFARSVSDGG